MNYLKEEEGIDDQNSKKSEYIKENTKKIKKKTNQDTYEVEYIYGKNI
jgi:hypothetical protein